MVSCQKSRYNIFSRGIRCDSNICGILLNISVNYFPANIYVCGSTLVSALVLSGAKNLYFTMFGGVKVISLRNAEAVIVNVVEKYSISA